MKRATSGLVGNKFFELRQAGRVEWAADGGGDWLGGGLREAVSRSGDLGADSVGAVAELHVPGWTASGLEGQGVPSSSRTPRPGEYGKKVVGEGKSCYIFRSLAPPAS